MPINKEKRKLRLFTFLRVKLCKIIRYRKVLNAENRSYEY